VKEGVGAYEESQFGGEAGPCLSAQGRGDPLQGLSLTICTPRIGAGHLLEALCEYPL
jgi:hypothetical protein